MILGILYALFKSLLLPLGLLFDGFELSELLVFLNALSAAGLYTTAIRLQTFEFSPVLADDLLRCFLGTYMMCAVTIQDSSAGYRLQGACLFDNVVQLVMPLLRGPILSSYGCGSFDTSKKSVQWPDGTPPCETEEGLESARWCLWSIVRSFSLVGGLVAPKFGTEMLLIASVVQGSKWLLSLPAAIIDDESSILQHVFDVLQKVLLIIVGLYTQRKIRSSRKKASSGIADGMERLEVARERHRCCRCMQNYPKTLGCGFFVICLPFRFLKGISLLIGVVIRSPEELVRWMLHWCKSLKKPVKQQPCAIVPIEPEVSSKKDCAEPVAFQEQEDLAAQPEDVERKDGSNAAGQDHDREMIVQIESEVSSSKDCAEPVAFQEQEDLAAQPEDVERKDGSNAVGQDHDRAMIEEQVDEPAGFEEKHTDAALKIQSKSKADEDVDEEQKQVDLEDQQEHAQPEVDGEAEGEQSENKVEEDTEEEQKQADTEEHQKQTEPELLVDAEKEQEWAAADVEQEKADEKAEEQQGQVAAEEEQKQVVGDAGEEQKRVEAEAVGQHDIESALDKPLALQSDGAADKPQVEGGALPKRAPQKAFVIRKAKKR